MLLGLGVLLDGLRRFLVGSDPQSLPIIGIGLWRGWDDILVEIGVLFSKAAVVTFGGAYAVLGYIGQQAVNIHGWITPAQMMDGLHLVVVQGGGNGGQGTAAEIARRFGSGFGSIGAEGRHHSQVCWHCLAVKAESPGIPAALTMLRAAQGPEPTASAKMALRFPTTPLERRTLPCTT